MIRISIWTAILLVVLRLAIGWHFLVEGLYKVETVYKGETTTSKPFSSEGFFRKAEGPLAKEMREYIGDPDEQALAKLAVKGAPENADPSKVPPHTLMPDALEREWDDYFNRFVAAYKLDEAEKKTAEDKLRQAKDDFVKWLLTGSKEVKKKGPGGGDFDETVSTEQRVAEYKFKLSRIRDAYERANPKFRQNVEKGYLPALEADASALRTELLKDLDGYTSKMKDALASIVSDRTSGFSPKLIDKDIDVAYLKVLEPAKADLPPGHEDEAMPTALASQWDKYIGYAKEFGNIAPDKQGQADEKLQRTKRHYVLWLTGRDEYTGEPDPNSDIAARVQAYRAAVDRYHKLNEEWQAKRWLFLWPKPTGYDEAERNVAYIRSGFQSDIQRQNDVMKSLVGATLSDEQQKGYAPVVKEKPRVDRVDWLTRWGLVVLGICLIVGLLTRLACLGGGVFLALIVLSAPAAPWLPAPPGPSHFLFIDNNVIEMLALFVLATTRSGKWLGLDALLSRCCGGRQRAEVKAKTRQPALAD
jgi:uncharacterized membrane protein YphA (DoxX/SURF4 family)